MIIKSVEREGSWFHPRFGEGTSQREGEAGTGWGGFEQGRIRPREGSGGGQGGKHLRLILLLLAAEKGDVSQVAAVEAVVAGGLLRLGAAVLGVLPGTPLGAAESGDELRFLGEKK